MQVEFGFSQADFDIKFVNKNDYKNHKNSLELFDLYDFKASGTCLDIAQKCLYVSIDKDIDYASLICTIGKAIKQIKGLKIASIGLDFCKLSCEFYSAYSHIYAVLAALYSFDKYKSESKKSTISKIILRCDENEDLKEGVELAKILADACASVKDIVNEVPSVYTQSSFAKDAEKLSQDLGIECKIYGDEFLQKEKMNAFLAVNKASSEEAKLIHLSYKAQNPIKKVVFVGKGLVYDTGGLSLKPADYMLTMKSDKAGAAAVFGIVKAAAMLKLPFEIHGILACAQNCISEKSYMPDDVIVAREGKSVEVRNTDAEGRLVLIDALSYAQDLKPDLLIDLATLTGACVVGVGEYTSAIMGYNEELQNEFYANSKKSGEYTSVLHFNPYIKELIKSKIADVSNCASSRYGGAISAGMFLGEFIRDEYKDKWLHLDIAGPAYLEKEWGENAFGASAAGVRMNIINLIRMARSK